MRKPPRAFVAFLVAAGLLPGVARSEPPDDPAPAAESPEKTPPSCPASDEVRRSLRKAFVSNLPLAESSSLVDALEKKSQEPIPAGEAAGASADDAGTSPCNAKEIEGLRKQIAAVAAVQKHPMLDVSPGMFESELTAYNRQIHAVAKSLELAQVEEIPVGRAYVNLKIPADRRGAVAAPSNETTKRLEESRKGMMTTERRLNLKGMKDVFGQAPQAGELQDASAAPAGAAAAVPLSGAERPDAFSADGDHRGRPGPSRGRGLDSAADGIDRALAARAPRPIPTAVSETAEQAGVKHIQAAENPDVAFVERWMHGGAAKGDALIEGVKHVASGDQEAVARAGEGAIAGTAEVLTAPAADLTKVLEKHFNPQGLVAQGAPIGDHSQPIEAVENIPADPALARARAEKRRYVNADPVTIKKQFGPDDGRPQPITEGDAPVDETPALDEAAQSRARARSGRYINTDPAAIKKRFGQHNDGAGDSADNPDPNP